MPMPHDKQIDNQMVADSVSKSSQSWSRYMTTRGLTEHIGTDVSHFHLYIAKEDNDNAADYLENNYMGARDIRVISVWVQTNDNTLRITVRNSNIDNKSTAFQTNLKDIVDYDYFTSTKKNKFRIGRGAIGDATKPKLSIPYALLYEKGIINKMAAPLIIQYNNQESRISLDTHKFITNKLEALIETKEKPVTNNYTQVQLTIPRGELSYGLVNELKEYYLNYSVFSTHIKFNFDFNGDRVTTPNDGMASNTWTNTISIWCYTFSEFEVFLENLVNQSVHIFTVLDSFRELKWLPKEWKQRVLGELTNEEKRCLFTNLKTHSKPMERLPVPYGGSKECDELRKKALINRIASIYEVKERVTEYKVVRARYLSPDGEVNFPYVFEVIAIPFEDIYSSSHMFIGSVNNSVSIINRGKSLYDGMYALKDGSTVWNMDGILNRWYGYYLRDSKKSWPCIIAANLLTPKVQWKEQGKSTLVIEPFAGTIIDTIIKAMKRIPTFHGMGLGRSSSKSKKEDKLDKPKKS